MWAFLWKGNDILSCFLSRKIPWIHYPARRFLTGVVVNIGYTVLAVLFLLKSFEYFFNITLGEGGQYTLYGAIIVTILISFFIHAREFLSFWRKASFQKEKFEKESIAARYESLKNQVSPHFLFNSLNALTNLVYEDPDRAVKFIKQLSEVYRYVLETRDKEVVPVSEELAFLDSYLFLQRIRFGDKLEVKIHDINRNVGVAPLALQMLIENAIKHNIISEEDPLRIKLYADNGFLVVENNLQRKQTLDTESSSGLGLVNICKRYEYLSNEKVGVAESEGFFVVRLPALKELNA
jgi:sensor histidine kinase YesM